MPIDLMKYPPYANTDQIHELERAIIEFEHHLRTVEEDRLGDLQWPEGRMKVSELHALVSRQEATFSALLAAAQNVYDCMDAPRLPADIRAFAQTWQNKRVAQQVGHLRNIRVHWAKNHQYFSTTHPVSPPPHRNTRSVHWYLGQYPGKYPMHTYRRNGVYLIGNAVNVMRLKKQMGQLRGIVDAYYV